MNKNLQNIEDLYKKLIEEHTEMPPAIIWDTINKNLDEKKIISLKRKYTDLKKLTAVLLVLFISALAYYYGNQKKTTKEKPVIIEETINKPGTTIKIVAKADLKLNKLNKHIVPEKNSTKLEPIQEKIIGINSLHIISDYKKDIAKKELIPETNNTLPTDPVKTNQLTAQAKKINTFSNWQRSIKNSVINTKKKSGIATLITDREASNISSNTTIPFIEQNDALLSTEAITVKNYNFPNNEQNKNKYIKLKAAHSLNVIAHKENDYQKIIITLSKIPAQPLLVNTLKVANIKTTGLKEALNVSRKNSRMAAGRFSITIYASPELAFNRIEDDKKDGINGPPGNNRPPDDRHKIKQEEQNTKSFSSGLLVDYALNNKWSIQSGISLISKSSETEPKKVFAVRDNNGDIKYKYNCAFGSSFISPKNGSAPVVGDSTIADFTSNNIVYIGVPLNFSYQLKKGKFQINPTAGITFNFLVKQATNTSITDASGAQKERGKPINGLKSNYLNANFGMDINYWLSKKLALTLVPTTLLALNSVNQNSTVKSYPNSFGIRAGLKVNF